MKSLNLLFLLAFAMIAFLFSCQTTESINIEMTEEEAVETVEQSFAKAAAGYAKYVEGLATVYAITNDSCTITGDTMLVSAITAGTTTYRDSSTYTYTLNCSGGLPSSLGVNASSKSTFTTPKISATANGNATNNTVGNLGVAQTEYDIDGVYSRVGTMTSKIAQKGSYTYNLTCTMTNVMVNKTTKVITGGTATYTFSGVSTGFGTKSFNYSGNITFNGAGVATLTLANNTHTIDIN